MKSLIPPTKIPGQRIELRKLEANLAEKMFAYVDKDRVRLRKYLPWVEHVKTVADEVAFIAKSHADWEAGKVYGYGIFLKDSDEYLGNIGVHSIGLINHFCEIGYWILGDFEGKGYMSEAVKVLEEALFAVGFNRICILCDPRNERSARIPLRSGYRYEGIVEGRIRDGMDYLEVFEFSKTRGAVAAQRSPVAMQVTETRIHVADMLASVEWMKKFLKSEPDYSEVGAFVRFRLGSDSTLALVPADAKSPTSLGGGTPYLRVLDLGAAIKLAEALGGKVYRGPGAIENGESICQILTPHGFVVGLQGKA